LIIIWILLFYLGFIPWDWLYQIRWYAIAGAITLGLIFSFSIVLPFASFKKSFLADFFFGRLENPQLWGGRVDAKMYLYLVGAIMLGLNILSYVAHHYILFGELASPGVYIAAALLAFFIIDYLSFEEVHLYAYDFIAERVGFKLGWGCIAFYPFFYSIPIWSTADLPNPQIPIYLYVIYILIFFGSWTLSRGANLQKYFIKKMSNVNFWEFYRKQLPMEIKPYWLMDFGV